MADLATTLIRVVARSFYTTEHILVVEALILHSTLSDLDLAHVLGMQPKSLRKLCGRLREDGLISVQTRAEKRTDDVPSYYPNSHGKDGKPRERLTNRDWYYLNYHRAIDSIKWRMHKLNRHVESLGAPTTEKKDLRCPRCKAEYTELEAMDKLDDMTGEFACHRCGGILIAVEEDERANENEMMKRLNVQFAKLLDLLRDIDSAAVPENDFETALSKQRVVERGADNPGARTQVVDLPNRNMASAKGLEMKPEKVAVNLQDEETVKRETEEQEARLQREKEAKQNALPEWISRSTIDGAMTVSGAKEERERLARQAHLGDATSNGDIKEEKKPVASSGGDDDVMAAYWEELARAKEREAAEEEEDDEEEDDDEDDFQDVNISGGGGANSAKGAAGSAFVVPSGNATPGLETSASTPAGAVSSSATDDEPEAKRRRIDHPPTSSTISNGIKADSKAVEDTPAASDEDEDDDGLEFENV
ncbi:hypothetical protein K431DRAFT_287838 [Polychaeton citri CBS 116435]|uniref:HTH TFE/IIEalpha-type domain-containing protein n=1 Tax=Polychaeton citri CBS 116435 TaxID=1314669 RepID=A0A9P4Q0A4_9PEZI|nr:hypothetical protein K431DRAFT_287838 [Polychaeton citri CBS 116435]